MFNINEMYDEYVEFYMFYMPHPDGLTETILYTLKKYEEFKNKLDDAFFDEGISSVEMNRVVNFNGELTVKTGINKVVDKRIGETNKNSVMMQKGEICIVLPCLHPVKLDEICNKYFGHDFIETEGIYRYYQGSFDSFISFEEDEDDYEDEE